MSAFLAMVLAAAPTWQELARADAALEAQLGRLAPERQKQVRAVLENMAGCAATADGVRAAWKLVADALPGLEKPDFAGSGEGPNRAALRTAGARVLTGLVTRAAEKLKTKAGLDELLGAIDVLDNMKPDARTRLKDEARTAAKVKP